MTEQQKIIFEGACRLMSGLLEAGAVKSCNDAQRDNYNKYCIQKAQKLYEQTQMLVK